MSLGAIPSHIPNAIQWHEGMLLSPHHFQQDALRQAGILGFLLAHEIHYHFGIIDIKFELSALTHGIVRLEHIVGIMPDGLVFSHQAGNKKVLEFDLKQLGSNQSKLKKSVFIGVPKFLGTNFVVGDYSRFLSTDGEMVSDLNTGRNDTDIPRLEPNLKLLIDDAPPAKYICIKIAELSFEDNLWKFEKYVPACLKVERGHDLYTLCSEIFSALRTKIIYLAEQITSTNTTQGATFISENRFLIHSLGYPLPYLEALVTNSCSHPFELYKALCLVLGSIGVLGDSMVPVVPPAYHHEDLFSVFSEMKTLISETIKRGINEKYEVGVFTRENMTFGYTLPSGFNEKEVVVGLRKSYGASDSETIEWFNSAIIGSQSKVQSIRDNRVIGCKRMVIEKSEDIIPPRGVLLFKLVLDPLFIDKETDLRIFNDTVKKGFPEELLFYFKRE